MDWEKIRWEYETSNVTLKILADKHDIKLGTLKSRKSREGWLRDATSKKDATKKKKDATSKKDAELKKPRKEQENRSGNPNPKNQFSERNSAARKHGLFSRYIPRETLEIMGMLDKANPIDLLWDQIQIQYAAIIRSQEIMFVQDKNELHKELKKRKESYSANGGSSEEEEWEVQFAFDRQATFLIAQSKAIAELRTSLKQFEEMAHIDDERRLKLEGMRLGIEKTRAEVEKIKSGEDDKPIEITIKRKT
jgi:uncharacterized protein YjcR